MKFEKTKAISEQITKLKTCFSIISIYRIPISTKNVLQHIFFRIQEISKIVFFVKTNLKIRYDRNTFSYEQPKIANYRSGNWITISVEIFYGQ